MSNLTKKDLHVITIGSDRHLFNEKSAVRERAVEYSSFFARYSVIVFTLKNQGFEQQEIASGMVLYPTNSLSRWFYVWDAVRISKKIPKASHEIITAQDPFESGLVAHRIAKERKCPFQLQIHTDFLSPFFTKGSLLNLIRVMMAKRILPFADGIRVVSMRIKKSMEGIHLKTVPMVLPIRGNVEGNAARSRNTYLKEKYSRFSHILLIASRLSKEKAIHTAIRAFHKVAQKNPQIGLLVVGEGSEKESLVGLAGRLGLQDKVIFEGWQGDLSNHFKSADAFILCSLYEGYGLTLSESVAYGCPIISSDVGIAREVIDEGMNGFICPVGDEHCFADKMSEIVSSEASDRLKNGALAKARSYELISKEEYARIYSDALLNCYISKK